MSFVAAVAAAAAVVAPALIVIGISITIPATFIGVPVTTNTTSSIAIPGGDVAMRCGRCVGLPLPCLPIMPNTSVIMTTQISSLNLAGPRFDGMCASRLSSLLSWVGDVLSVPRHLI